MDYFEARYLRGSLGRFTSPDPSTLSVDWWVPQSWNRYAYALNNPLAYVDNNGLWPTYVHNQIIKEAFPGLKPQQLQALMQASEQMDYANQVDVGNGQVVGAQDPAASFVHGMRNGLTNQNPAEAQGMGDSFISRNEQGARKIQAAWIASGHTGIAPGALIAFGNAMHTVMDRTSPAHMGNQPWNGTAGVRNKLAAAEHVRRESYATAAERASAATQMRAAFLMVFGSALYQQAVPPPPKPKIKVKIKFQNDDGSAIQD